MDEIYSGIFSTLYNMQEGGRGWGVLPSSRVPDVRFFGEQVRRTIDDVAGRIQRELGVLVRSDAKYFLWMNVLHMIATPILISEREPANRVLESAVHDVDLVMRTAAEGIEAHPGSREVSAHRVVDALSRSWGKMKLSDVRIWDGHA
jgi:hypothetical protein